MELPDGGAVVRAKRIEQNLEDWGRQLYEALFTAENMLASYDIPLVVLEACRSATVGETAVFRSVAPRLIRAGVDSVLSMGHAVHVEAARLLLDRFYRELVRGASIGQAVAESRKALLSTPARWIESGPGGRTVELRDWFLPHLYQREADDVLVPPEAIGQQPVRQFDNRFYGLRGQRRGSREVCTTLRTDTMSPLDA